MDEGFVIAFGPALDPKAAYGLGIVEVDDESQVKEFIANDPASKICEYEPPNDGYSAGQIMLLQKLTG